MTAIFDATLQAILADCAKLQEGIRQKGYVEGNVEFGMPYGRPQFILRTGPVGKDGPSAFRLSERHPSAWAFPVADTYIEAFNQAAELVAYMDADPAITTAAWFDMSAYRRDDAA